MKVYGDTLVQVKALHLAAAALTIRDALREMGDQDLKAADNLEEVCWLLEALAEGLDAPDNNIDWDSE